MTGPATPGSESVREQVGRDPFAGRLGIELLDLTPGYCRAALRLGPDMVNFQGDPHGGAIFSLADYAFSGACNSHGEPAVALSVTIQYLAAARPGARLVAEAREQRQGRRAGFYVMTVTDDAGTVVAACQAVAFRRAG
ncbi:MAG TPA: hotdog fold thioesterase [Methylomirabilota bacterium]|jgi:acyl-CoA thioesterase|nr:hotdog fold thioesterase [Methylomirabilota bacterium]